MRKRDVAAAAVIVAAAVVASALPAVRVLDALSVDVLFWLRHRIYGPLHAPANSPTVVLALDEETYRREPFADTPRVMWTPQLAGVLEAVLAGGAKVVGFDIVFSTSLEPFFRGFERDFLLMLRRGAQDGRIVLGRVQHQEKPIQPHRGYSFAVGHARNVRALNLFEDDDGIVRRLPLTFVARSADGAERVEPGMAVELAARALGAAPAIDGDGRFELGGYAVPQDPPNTLLLNFDSGPGDIPSYSFADLWACTQAGDTDYFRRHFAGKVVLIGAVLDVEDRKITSKRWVTAPEGVNLPARCVHPVMPDLYAAGLRRDSTPGVYIHAAGVNNLLRRDALATPPEWQRLGLGLAVTAAAAAVTLGFAPPIAAAGLLLIALAWTAAAAVAFRHGVAIPLLTGVASGAVAVPLLFGYRFAVSDRSRRQISKAFALYLPAPVIERMMARERMPELGGEARGVSILFSDIAGFTGISERRTPTELAQDLNEYFAAMTEIVERHGGFVDKFIGDAVLAVFGAPLEDPQHPLKATLAAMEMRAVLAAGGDRFRFGGAAPIEARIGLNSGEALIGNIGSPRRFNYTVMGDAVNLASRIEGVNKMYGTRILVSEDTHAACGDAIVFREVDRVRVVGREQPVRLYEPVAPAGSVTDADRDGVRSFEAALALWRQARFAEAAEAFGRLGTRDPVAAKYAGRCAAMLAAPLPAGWDGTTNLTEK